MIQKQREETQYAKNIQGEEFHISEVERGKKGYYCIDCEQEMVACQSELDRSWYFRHHVTDVKIERKCTFSNETYRHKIAKDALQRIKQIKVPAVDKYAPKGTDGLTRLREAQVIHAYTVGIEYQFYEDEAGQIRWMSKPDWERIEPSGKKRHIIQPDVTFFDQLGQPILFIEIVATHKPDEDKLLKLERLCIDTVSVTIPKESATAIEQIFYHTDRTKWLYNHEERTARYVPVSGRNSKEVLPIDQLQRRLLEESVNCRATEIGNLIRAIERCLESEQYRSVEQHLNAEVSRVTDIAARAEQQLLGLQASHQKRLEKAVRGRILPLAKAARRVSSTERAVKARRKDLEGRYYKKRHELVRAEAEYRPDYQDEIERIATNLIELGAGDGSIPERQEQLAAETARTDERIGEAKRTTADIQRRTEALPDEFRQAEGRMVQTYRQQKKAVGADFRRQAQADEEADGRVRTELRERHEGYRRAVAQAVTRADGERTERLSPRIVELVKARGLIVDTSPKYAAFQRIRTAYETFKSGAYKSWP
ncbi:uncharacterized protein YfcZ (UPF0381/DUF406 family) [Spirosoma lacussanchae]|uniref:hypothetical protein n=1 Tax=Spirosoma lacussanchae TaxID=1884249 RepID=UPI0011088CCA|nr:hypothetical protein [Spirosoma lacussanchae]